VTDEERKKLCEKLRDKSIPCDELYDELIEAADEIERLAALAQPDAELGRGDFAKYVEQFNKEAMERALAEPIPRSPVAQKLINDTFDVEDEMELITKIRNYEAPPLPDAEPVAWRFNLSLSSQLWSFTDDRHVAANRRESGWRVEPLYAAPPRPDTSAGLIKAAEIASAFKGNADRRMRSDAGCEGYVRACDDLVAELRARAADRSEK
jgi:hypothetical protein